MGSPAFTHQVMHELGIGIDGGKDSLSMSARSDDGELCKCPGELTVSLYCGCRPETLSTAVIDSVVPRRARI